MNRKFLSFMLLAMLFTVSYFSCKKADPDPAPLSPEEEYFPMQKGKYLVYDVDSTIWDHINCVVAPKHYQIMYTFADTFRDNQNRLSYRIDTRIRKRPEDVWEAHEIFTVTNTGTTLEMEHGGLRFIKLQFPVVAGETWDGNSYINVGDTVLNYFKDWKYSYEGVQDAYNNGRAQFSNTITVIQVDQTINDPETMPNDSALRTYGKEVFASGLGMVYREYYHWTFNPKIDQNNDPNNPRRCRKGAGVIMRLVDHN